MRSTFIKIFAAFWLTEFLILICTIFILVREFESEEAVYTSAYGMLSFNAHLAVEAYEAGGCVALQKVPNTFPLHPKGVDSRENVQDQPAILFDASGNALCIQENTAQYSDAVAKMQQHHFLLPERRGPYYIVGVEIKGTAKSTLTPANETHYFYLIRGVFPKEVYIPYGELLPRLLIGLIVSVLVTFVVTMVITRPIGSLREAARQLAQGNMRARARWPKGKANRDSGDELWGLVYDFNEMAARLESLVDSQQLLLRDVSHELRSPLARLSVALELAREEAQPGMEEQLDRIERETGRLNALIGQLLSLSHLESTTRLPDRQLLPLLRIVQELLPDMEYEAQRRNSAVRLLETKSDLKSELDTTVSGNPELLARAIENVIRNAIAYTAEGTAVEISFTTEVRFGERFIVLSVHDHGPGVPEPSLRSIFRPFYRLDLSRQRSTGGYGVGLAITERAIRLHGGMVAACNAPEGGLIVEMRLPAAERS